MIRINKGRRERIPFVTRIARTILRIQYGWADFMHSKTMQWSRKEKIIFLVIITGVFSIINVCILLDVFSNRTNTGEEIRSSPMPVLFMQHHREFPRQEVIDTLAIYEFRKAIDSLRATPEGRKVYEDFARERPGFLDSLAYIEQHIRQPF
ncbi:hypothetical protein [Chitinophaga defluvii]|uniref:Uncharacterized protein n=1 Tax=Chitinophaga defluvii TaxID=3163343 RepID=A0ABV2T9U1_9BACT